MSTATWYCPGIGVQQWLDKNQNAKKQLNDMDNRPSAICVRSSSVQAVVGPLGPVSEIPNSLVTSWPLVV